MSSSSLTGGGPGTATSNNSSINSTPSADRYAALKDLDEQLRETKEQHHQVEHQHQQIPSNHPNPFKVNNGTCSNPFKAQVAWPSSADDFGAFPQSQNINNNNGFMTQGIFNGFPMNGVLANSVSGATF